MPRCINNAFNKCKSLPLTLPLLLLSTVVLALTEIGFFCREKLRLRVWKWIVSFIALMIFFLINRLVPVFEKYFFKSYDANFVRVLFYKICMDFLYHSRLKFANLTKLQEFRKKLNVFNYIYSSANNFSNRKTRIVK